MAERSRAELVEAVAEAMHKKLHPYYDDLNDCDKVWCNKNLRQAAEAAVEVFLGDNHEAS